MRLIFHITLNKIRTITLLFMLVWVANQWAEGATGNDATNESLQSAIEAIRSKIVQFIVRPCGDYPATIELRIQLALLPNGNILSYRIIQSSGYTPYDAAVERAILLAQPLPIPQAYDLKRQFTHLDLRFVPDRAGTQCNPEPNVGAPLNSPSNKLKKSNAATPSFGQAEFIGAIAIKIMRDLALEAAVACDEIGEPSGKDAMQQYQQVWEGTLVNFSRKLDRIEALLPRVPVADVQRWFKAKYEIVRPLKQLLPTVTEMERMNLCLSVAKTFMPFVNSPASILQTRGPETSIEKILNSTEADVREFGKALSENYTTPPALAIPTSGSPTLPPKDSTNLFGELEQLIEPADNAKNQSIARRQAEIQALEAKINQDLRNFNRRPRARFVGFTMEPRFGNYLEPIFKKIVATAASNYPAEAAGIYGSVQLTLTIASDGKIEKIAINRSSGQKILDDAAVRIVNLSAPFTPFPDDIQKDTDLLSVTRTFTFTTSENRVVPGDLRLWKPAAVDNPVQ